MAYSATRLAVSSDGRRLLTKVVIGLIELPFRDRLDLDFDSRVKRVDLFRKVEIDDRAIVESDSPGEGIQADLQSAVEVPPVRRFEKIDEVDAEERIRQRAAQSPSRAGRWFAAPRSIWRRRG